MTLPLPRSRADSVRADAGVPLPDDAPAGPPPRGRRARRLLRRLAQGLALLALVSVPWWGRAGLRRLDFFHVRAVEVSGTRYLEPQDVVQRLGVDTLRSIWDELAPLEQRVAGHPLVATVRLERRLPGTLRVHVEERLPVAFVPAAGGLRVLDALGHTLPIDPSRRPLDLPIASHADSALLRLLGELRDGHPTFYTQVSEVRRGSDGELLFRLPAVTVRTRTTVSAERFAEIRHVEDDLARRALRAVELDLRFRDQVIARLP